MRRITDRHAADEDGPAGTAGRQGQLRQRHNLHPPGARAREAYGRGEWLAAYGGLSDAAQDDLTAGDFARLATAAYLLGRRNDCVQALQRAYQLNLDADDWLAAVRSAFWLAYVLLTGGETAVGGGWVSRSQRLHCGAGRIRSRFRIRRTVQAPTR